jgi:predicted ribosome-associated RNA-binding protein Tma20
LFSADAKNQALGLTATASANVISFVQAKPTYSASTSAGATETVSVGPTVFGKGSVSVGGSATAGDTVTITTQFPALAGGQKA